MTENSDQPKTAFVDLDGFDETEKLATISASKPRRYFGLAVLYAFGAILLYIAASSPPADLRWLAFLLIVAGADIFLAEKFRKATKCSIYLTKEGLFCSDGRKMVDLDNVKSVDRGVFAFKPSNGFTVTTKTKQEKVWAPGLWWRLGARVGVGGVLQASQTKSMAEILVALAVAQHEKPD